MDREDEKKYAVGEYHWHILNNLSEFNDKSDLIREMYDKMKHFLPEHVILSPFYELYETVLEYYDRHKSFPDMDWITVNYAKSNRILKRLDDPFSIKVYEDCKKLIDAEIIKVRCANIVNTVNPDPSSLRALTDMISRYCDNADGIPLLDKQGIINLYEEYAKDYKGVKTGITLLDDVIGVLGHKSISVFGAPSGHGKSTFAISVAYNAALKQGLCVDYISYEVPKEHIWFNLISIFSKEKGVNLVASELKEGKLTEPQRALFQELASDFMKELNKSGGYINVLDQTTAAVDTFEALKARIESIATERRDGEKVYDRKADLIVVDNVDNFQILRSNERDEMVKVNNYIVSLDAFCKQYHHGDGCAILLLTQLNRGGLKKLQSASSESDPSIGASKIDVSVFQRYNALYEKGTCCLVGYADAATRLRNAMNIYAVKIRNRPVPEEPISLYADYAHSCIGGISTDEPNVVEISAHNYTENSSLSVESFVDADFEDII